MDFFKNKKINILDIGTGSGCILLSVLKELNYSRGTGIDISAKAINMAKKNSKNLNLIKRSKFKVFDLNKFNIGKYDLTCIIMWVNCVCYNKYIVCLFVCL